MIGVGNIDCRLGSMHLTKMLSLCLPARLFSQLSYVESSEMC